MIKSLKYLFSVVLLLSPPPSSNIFHQWFPNALQQVHVASAQVVSVGPFIEEEGLSECTASILNADLDFNSKIDRIEFNIAIAKWTNDVISALDAAQSLPLQMIFNEHACTIL